MSFDRESVRVLRLDLQNALEQFAKENEYAIYVGNATFTGNNITFKLEVSTLNQDGSVNTKESESFRRFASSYELNPDDLGRTFQFGEKTYTIIGMKPRSRKYPILCENNGKTYKFPASTVRMYLRDQQN